MSEKTKEENILNPKQQKKNSAASLFNLKRLFRKNPGDFIFENTTRFLAFVVLSITFQAQLRWV